MINVKLFFRTPKIKFDLLSQKSIRNNRIMELYPKFSYFELILEFEYHREWYSQELLVHSMRPVESLRFRDMTTLFMIKEDNEEAGQII